MVGKAKRIKLSDIKPSKSASTSTAAPAKPMRMAKASNGPDHYQAEMDARTLSEAAAIQADPARSKVARVAAAKLVKEHESKLTHLRAITKKGAA